jgi:hypothetical protein
MSMKKGTAPAGLLFLLVLATWARAGAGFETQGLSIQLDDTGAVRGLRDRGTGVDYVASQQPAPLLALRVAGQCHTL